MQDLVQFIVTNLADDAENIDVELIENDNNSEIIITAPKSEIGKIIGKQGRIAKAIRTLAKAGGSKTGKRYVVTINEK